MGEGRVGGAMTRANLAQARQDLAGARERAEETYYEWAAQLAREAASDALVLVEHEAGLPSPPEGRIGTLVERVETLAEAGEVDADLLEPATVLDEVLDPTLEPDHDPGLARREGGSADYLVAEDAEEAIEAASAITDACEARLAEPEEADGDEA